MEIIGYILVAVLSLFVVIKSAGLLIKSISVYAKKAGISEYIIGFLVVSIGTTLPDISTAIFASMIHQGQLILGDVVGANLLDMTIVIGLMAVIAKRIDIHEKIMNKTILIVIAMVSLPLILGLDGKFSRTDGVILMIAFGLYILRLVRKEKETGHIKNSVLWKNIWKEMFVFLGSLVALLLSARWLVVSTIEISKIWHIPIYFMGLIFIAIGTTTPEISVGIKSALSGKTSIAFGDVLGAIVVNSSFVIGLTAILSPFTFPKSSVLISAFFMILAVIIGVLLLRKGHLTRKMGILLLSIYFVFILTSIFSDKLAMFIVHLLFI